MVFPAQATDPANEASLLSGGHIEGTTRYFPTAFTGAGYPKTIKGWRRQKFANVSDQASANTSAIVALDLQQDAQDSLIAASATKAELAAIQILVDANVDKAIVTVARQPDQSLLITYDDTTTDTVAAASGGAITAHPDFTIGPGTADYDNDVVNGSTIKGLDQFWTSRLNNTLSTSFEEVLWEEAGPNETPWPVQTPLVIHNPSTAIRPFSWGIPGLTGKVTLVSQEGSTTVASAYNIPALSTAIVEQQGNVLEILVFDLVDVFRYDSNANAVADEESPGVKRRHPAKRILYIADDGIYQRPMAASSSAEFNGTADINWLKVASFVDGTIITNHIADTELHLPTASGGLQFVRRNVTNDGWEVVDLPITPQNLISGVGAPVDSLGQDGWYYIEYGVAAGQNNVWGPKATGAWPAQADNRAVITKQLTIADLQPIGGNDDFGEINRVALNAWLDAAVPTTSKNFINGVVNSYDPNNFRRGKAYEQKYVATADGTKLLFANSGPVRDYTTNAAPTITEVNLNEGDQCNVWWVGELGGRNVWIERINDNIGIGIDAAAAWDTDVDYVGQDNVPFSLVLPATAGTAPYVTADGKTLTAGNRYNLQYAADRTAGDSVAVIDDDLPTVGEIALMNLIGEVSSTASGPLPRRADASTDGTPIQVQVDEELNIGVASVSADLLIPDLTNYNGLSDERRGRIVNFSPNRFPINDNGNANITNNLTAVEARSVYEWRQTASGLFYVRYVGRLYDNPEQEYRGEAGVPLYETRNIYYNNETKGANPAPEGNRILRIETVQADSTDSKGVRDAAVIRYEERVPNAENDEWVLRIPSIVPTAPGTTPVRHTDSMTLCPVIILPNGNNAQLFDITVIHSNEVTPDHIGTGTSFSWKRIITVGSRIGTLHMSIIDLDQSIVDIVDWSFIQVGDNLATDLRLRYSGAAWHVGSNHLNNMNGSGAEGRWWRPNTASTHTPMTNQFEIGNIDLDGGVIASAMNSGANGRNMRYIGYWETVGN